MTPEGIPPQDLQFADLAVRQGLCTSGNVEECISILRRLREAKVEPLPTLGELLVQRGFLAPTPAEETLHADRERPEPQAAGLPGEVADAARDPRNLFGKFILVRQVGQGGFGAVYRAWQRDLGRIVAIKFLHSEDEADVQRFVREAQTAAKLQHPHIVPIYEVGEQDGRNYLAMEFVDGETLNRLRLEPRRAVEVTREAALAVQYAHEKGIIHRDLKPQNLMMGREGHVWVLDFGLARQLTGGATLTVSGAVVGTPAYMPPEQAQGGKCDERSDVYSLGATLYELLTARRPFEAATPLEVLKQIAESDPTAVRKINSKVHPEIETIVAKAMEKSPARRYASAKEFQEDLRRYIEGEPILARPSTLASRAVKWVKRHRMASAVGGVVLAALLLLAAGGAFYVVNLDRARVAAEAAAVRERDEAERARRAQAETQREYLHGLVSQGEALGKADRWEAARGRFAEAREGFERLGLSTFPADLGWWEVSQHYFTPFLKLKGHSDRVLSVAFSPDGARALTGSKDRTVKLWDPATGLELRTLRGHRGLVRAVAFSPDGRRAVTGDNVGEVKLWDLDAGHELLAIQDSEEPIGCVAFSTDGAGVASSSVFGPLTLWDAGTGRRLRSFEGSIGVQGTAFLPGGRRILSGSQDRSLRLWDVESGRELRAFVGPNSASSCLTLSPDGRKVVSGGHDGSLRLWDVESGRQERLFPRSGISPPQTVAYCPEGTRVLAGYGDGALEMIDVESGRVLRTLVGHSAMVISVAVSPDGRWALSGGADPEPSLWTLVPGRQRRSVKTGQGWSSASALSPDGRLAVTTAGGGLRLWDVETARELLTMSGHRGRPYTAAFSPDGSRVLSGCIDGELKLWEVGTGREVRTFMGHPGNLICVGFSPDGKLALTGSSDRVVVLWDVATGDRLSTFAGHTAGVQCIVFTPDGTRVLSGSIDKTLRLWDIESGREIRSLQGHDGVINSVAITADGSRAVSGGTDRTLKVWDLKTGRELLSMKGHEKAVARVAVSPDGTWALSGGFDALLKVWDLVSGREIHTFEEAGSVSSVGVSSDGKVLFSAAGGTLEFLDLSVSAALRRLEPDAARAFQRIREIPITGPSYSLLGTWYGLHGILDRSIESLERARSAGGSASPLALGRCYWQRGNLQEAAREFREALKLHEAPEVYLKLCLQAIERESSAEPPEK